MSNSRSIKQSRRNVFYGCKLKNVLFAEISSEEENETGSDVETSLRTASQRGRKEIRRASRSVVTPRAKRVGRGGACRHRFQCTVPPLGD